MKTFGEKMLEARKARGMRQLEFGKMLGVSSRMIIDYEGGLRRPHRSKLQEFAEKLELPVEYLENDRFDTVLSVFNQSTEEMDADSSANSFTKPSSLSQTDIEALARREIEFLQERSVALFAGGALPQEVKDAFFQSLYEAYLKCRKQAAENNAEVNQS